MAKRRETWGRRSKTEQGIIMAFALTHGATRASKEFGLSLRSIQRYIADVKAGKDPALAQCVAKERDTAVARSRDKLSITLDILLDRIQAESATASFADTVDAVDKIGGLLVARDAIGDKENYESHGRSSHGTDPGGSRPSNAGATITRIQDFAAGKNSP